MAVKCTAHRKDGEPCGNSPMTGTNVCRLHGGSAPQVRRKAQERILQASDLAAENLIKWMGDGKVPWPQRVAVAQDLLNRANISGKQQIELTTPRYETLLTEGEIVIDVEPEQPLPPPAPDYQAELEELI